MSTWSSSRKNMGISPFACLYFMLIILIPSNYFRLSSAANITEYEICRKPFQCEFIKDLSYPFYDGQNQPAYCGYPGFQLNCSKPMPQLSVGTSSEKYYVLSVSPSTHSLAVSRADYWYTLCPSTLSNISINFNLFNYEDRNLNITLYYGCSPTSSNTSMNRFSCTNMDNITSISYPMTKDLDPSLAVIPQKTCKTKIFVPLYQSAVVSITDVASLMAALRNGFGLQWAAENELCSTCRGSGGECGYNTSTSKFTCYCPDYQPYGYKCNGYNRKKIPIIAEIILPVTVSLSTLAVGIVISVVVYLKRRRPIDNQDIETFLKTYGSPGPKRYSYGELKKITNSFSEKLGEGGYGTVYKGKLHDGNLVAVKLLKKSKGNAEEFINEVATVGSTNHINIVTLLGFCFEGQKRALVYDYMPNGSLEKFIYKNTHQSLSWETLFQITVGIARGLEYLHQGCNTRILHFDIKPHNILLDEEFCPKISDFGLAKSCQHKDNIIPMSAARGTAGYIAPEVFLKSFGGVSYKSDVYSYGMLVLEMVGCSKNADIKDEYGDEEFFPNWIYKQLEKDEEIGPQLTLNNMGREIQRKMIMVSLWCIQTNPSNRPTISRVVEMLEGKLESLSYPPIQSFEYPDWLQPNSLTMGTSSLSQVPSCSITQSTRLAEHCQFTEDSKEQCMVPGR